VILQTVGSRVDSKSPPDCGVQRGKYAIFRPWGPALIMSSCRLWATSWIVRGPQIMGFSVEKCDPSDRGVQGG
jgi:hypothetical protein